uniref:Uncharacterized protein n=1 Tax=viral metagenome TaxID=1070528 RepID=A0A6C0JZG6_9ZZZZ
MQIDDISKNPYNYLLYRSSQITIISVCYAIYSQKSVYVISTGSVLCTSLLYWKNPTLGLRRNIDMMVVNSVFVYHSYMAIGNNYAYEHYFFTWFGILCYGLSWYFQHKNNVFICTIMHILLHIFSNIGVIYLIAG